MGRKYTLEEIKQKLNDKFPNYNISNLETYKNTSSLVHFKCDKHNYESDISVGYLLKLKSPCKWCNLEQSSNRLGITYNSTDEFITEFHRKWPNIPYTFEHTNYVESHGKIKITCPKHGVFEYRACALLAYGNVCPNCRKEEKIKNKYEHFKNKSKSITIDALKEQTNINIDISQFDISNLTNKSIIYGTCSKHGNFKLQLNRIIRRINTKRQICPDCNRFHDRQYSTNEFINMLKNIYFDKNYDYSQLKYIDFYTKVQIICPVHGSFWRLPRRLLESRGCPYCKEPLLEREIRIFLTKNNIKFIQQYMNIKQFKLKRYDFYLPEYNAIIECQGRQHFFLNSIFNSEHKTIDDIYKYDEYKYNLAKKYGIKVFYYSHFKIKNYYDIVYNNKELML